MKNVRLTSQEIKTIHNLCGETFGKGSKVYLFGSRADIHKKGGDIDLYIIPAEKERLFEKKISFLIRLKEKIGEQKIDVVIAKDPTRLIEKVACQNGVEL